MADELTSPRWHLTTCTRCNTTIQPGERAFRLYAARYEPMPEGPDYECVGDWRDPMTVPGLLCGPCEDAVERFTMGFEFAPAGAGLEGRWGQ